MSSVRTKLERIRLPKWQTPVTAKPCFSTAVFLEKVLSGAIMDIS
jgi:hypothetical protein